MEKRVLDNLGNLRKVPSFSEIIASLNNEALFSDEEWPSQAEGGRLRKDERSRLAGIARSNKSKEKEEIPLYPKQKEDKTDKNKDTGPEGPLPENVEGKDEEEKDDLKKEDPLKMKPLKIKKSLKGQD